MGRRLLLRFGRLLLWSALLLLLLLVPLLAMLGSESGSRWLLERGLAMQQGLSVRQQQGTLLTGLELEDVHFQTSRMDLRIRQVLARWSLWQLLRGDIEVQTLQVSGLRLQKLAPPDNQPTRLPTLRVPVRLLLRDARLEDASLLTWRAMQPRTLKRLELAGEWQGTDARIEHLHAEQEQVGSLTLQGHIRLQGDYPLEADGALDFLPFRAKDWQPLAVSLRHTVADLDIRLEAQGGLAASARGAIKPLLPELPYHAFLEWQPLKLPWWTDQSLYSQGGYLRLVGNRSGLRSKGEAQLGGRQLPAGKYAWDGATNWHSAKIDAFNFNGLGGSLKAKADVEWRDGVSWNLSSHLQQIDPARQWKLPPGLVPVLTGELESTGHTRKEGSVFNASLHMADGESWDLGQEGQSWPWNLQASQHVSLEWRNVQRSVPGLQSLYSTEGRLEAKGTRKDYWLMLDTTLASPHLPTGRWSAEMGGAERHVNVERLDYQGGTGELGFVGALELEAPLRWQGSLTLNHFGTDWLSENWSGQFSGHITGQGLWGSAQREFHLQETHLEGTMRKQALLAKGAVDVVLSPGVWPEIWTPGLSLHWGRNQAMLTGGLADKRWGLSAQLDMVDLHLLEPRLQGELRGQFALQGEERHPDIQADLSGQSLGTRGWVAHTAHFQAGVRALGEQPSHIALELSGLTSSSGRDWGGLKFDLAGTRASHVLQWQVEGDSLNGAGGFSGQRVEGGWSGRMDAGRLSLGSNMTWLLAAPFALDWKQSEKQLRLAPHCWISEEAHFCNEEEMQIGPVGHLHIDLQGLQLQRFASLMPEGLLLSGRVAGSAVGSWQPGREPVFKADLAAQDGKFQLAREEAKPPLVLPYERITMAAQANTGGVDLRLGMLSDAMGQGEMQARINLEGTDKALQGQLGLHGLRLDIFQPFFPGLTALTGKVSADGRLEGTLAKPAFWGAVQLSAGEIGFQRLPLHINDIETRIDVQGTQAAINGSMRSGEGKATLSGRADWVDVPSLNLALKGERFQLRQPPEVLAEVDPDLSLQVVPKKVDLTGSIRVPMARLNLKPLSRQAVPLSSDIRIVSRSDSEQAQLLDNVRGWDINADIRVLLGDDVYFHGYGVNGRLMGDLSLRQQGRLGLEASGEIELDKDARYDAYGQRLKIRRGRLIFAGNLTQPGLDVEAVREVDNKVVGVRVQGRANAPEATLFSDTSMSQEEIVSYLVLGRPLDATGKPETGGGNSNLAAAAAAATLGTGLASHVGETLGITDLAVNTEGRGGDDTQVTVSGYISPKLYLRYGVGIFTPVNTATIRYKINSKLYLEAVSSLENAIDLFYNLRF